MPTRGGESSETGSDVTAQRSGCNCSESHPTPTGHLSVPAKQEGRLTNTPPLTICPHMTAAPAGSAVPKGPAGGVNCQCLEERLSPPPFSSCRFRSHRRVAPEDRVRPEPQDPGWPTRPESVWLPTEPKAFCFPPAYGGMQEESQLPCSKHITASWWVDSWAASSPVAAPTFGREGNSWSKRNPLFRSAPQCFGDNKSAVLSEICPATLRSYIRRNDCACHV